MIFLQCSFCSIVYWYFSILLMRLYTQLTCFMLLTFHKMTVKSMASPKYRALWVYLLVISFILIHTWIFFFFGLLFTMKIFFLKFTVSWHLDHNILWSNTFQKVRLIRRFLQSTVVFLHSDLVTNSTTKNKWKQLC